MSNVGSEETLASTAEPNFEALYAETLDNLERAGLDNDRLRDKVQRLERQLAYNEGVKHTLEVICGVEFPKLFAPEI